MEKIYSLNKIKSQTQAKIFAVFLVLCAFLFFGTKNAQAAVTVTAATGGGAISADTTGGTWTTLTGPVMTEGTNRDMGVNNTVILTAPSGFIWNTAQAVTATIAKVGGTGTTCFTMGAGSYVDNTHLSFTVTARDGTNITCKVTFSNLQTRPSAGTPLASGNITNTGTQLPNGVGTNYGTLTEIAGILASFTWSAIGAQTAGTGFTPTITAKDAYGNTTATDTDGTALTTTESVTFTTTATALGAYNPTYNGNSMLGAGYTTNVNLSTGSFVTSNIILYKASETPTITITHNTKTGVTSAITVNPAIKNKLSWVTSPTSPQSAGSSWSPSPEIEILDTYGNRTTDTDSVTMVPSVGSFSAGASTNAVSGLATFSGLQYNTPGTLTVHGHDGTLTDTSESGSITVNAGPAATFVITGGGSQNAGASNALTITAKDAGGNTATSYTGDKSLTFSGANSIGSNNPTVTDKTGAPVAFGSPTTITFTNGVSSAGGSMVLYKAEAANIAATESSITTPSPLSVTVSAGTATTFTIAGSASQTAGNSNALTLTAKDTYGNTAAAYTGDKSLTFSGANTVGSNNPTVTDKNGTATNFGSPTTITFASGVSSVGGTAVLYKKETASIAATDGVVTTPSPLSVSVSAAIKNKLGWVTSPTSPQAAGVTWSPSPQIEILDTYGNRTADTDTITMVPSAGSFSAGATAAAVSGLATFSGLQYSSVASITVHGHDGTLTDTSESGSITVGGTDRYWVGGAASVAWNSTTGCSGTTCWAYISGDAPGAPVPNSTNDVYFNGASGAGTAELTAGITVKTLTMTGYTGTFLHDAGVTLTIAGNTYTLASGMTYTLGDAGTAATSFTSTTGTAGSPTQITASGKTLGNVTLNGSGGYFQLNDNFTANTITQTAGTILANATLTMSSASTASDLTIASGGILKNSGADSTLTIKSGKSIIVNQPINSTSNKLNIVLDADSGANSSGYINVASTITSNGGNIYLGGGASCTSSGCTSYAVGNAGQASGVYVGSSKTVNSGGGNIIVRGQGYNTTTNNNHGVYVLGGTITAGASGSGTVGIYGLGKGMTSSGSDYGLYITSGGVISSFDGALTVNATGGGAGGGTSNNGVEVNGLNSTIKTTGSGALSVTGTGGNAGGSGNFNFGVHSYSSNGIQTTGSGDVTVTGYGGSGSGTGSNNYGVVTETTNAITTTGTGNVIVNGTGGGSGASSNYNIGVYVYPSSSITAASGYNITLNGTGGSSSGVNNYGVDVGGPGAVTATGAGAITITAQGGGNNSAHNVGFEVETGGVVSSVDGSITINGTGSGVGSGSLNYGVEVTGANSTIKTTGVGNIVVNATKGSDTTNNGIKIAIANAINTTSSGNITINTDSAMSLTESGDINSVGSLTVTPKTASVTFGVAGGAGTFQLDATTLGYLTYASLQIGTVSQTGNTTVNAYSSWSKPITFAHSVTGSITISGDQVNSDSFTFAGPTTLSANATSSALTIAGGTFTASSRIIALTGNGTVFSNSGTYSGTGSTIKLTDTSNTDATFAGNGGTYHNLWFDGGATTKTYTITGANTFNDIKDTGTAAHAITFPNVTTTVTTFSVSGADSTHKITLQRTGASGSWTISKTSGTVSVSNDIISNSIATGGASWYALVSNNNTNGGGNSGWVFTNTPTVVTNAVTGINVTSATGNGEITATGGENADKRGFVYDTSSHGDPGNTAPGSSGYASYVEETGSFGAASFNNTLTSLSGSTRYYVRAYAHNSNGYNYGTEVFFDTLAPSVSISLSQSSFSYGVLSANVASTTLNLFSGDGIIVTNTGNVTEDFDIYGANATGVGTSWVLDNANTVQDHYIHKFCNKTDTSCTLPGGEANYTPLTGTPATFKHGITVSGTAAFQLQITTPQTLSDYNQKSAEVTIQASQQ